MVAKTGLCAQKRKRFCRRQAFLWWEAIALQEQKADKQKGHTEVEVAVPYRSLAECKLMIAMQLDI